MFTKVVVLWLLKFFMVLVVSTALISCGTKKPQSTFTSKSPDRVEELKAFPDDVSTKPETVDMQLALKDRGLYLNTFGDVKFIDTSSCLLEVAAHRGDHHQPENSLKAIQQGLVGGYNTIEIDIIQLRDGYWVVHHDAATGRAVDIPNKKPVRLSRMTANDWLYARHRSPQTRKLVDVRPPYLFETIDAFKADALPNQKINIEIKSKITSSEIFGVDKVIRATLGDGNYYYSSLNLESLEKVRSVNPDVYLGFIQKPHNKSIRILKKNMKKGMGNDPIYRKYRSEVDALSNYGEKYYWWINKDWTSAGTLNKIKKLLGSNSGLHIDIRRLAETPNVILRAHKRGMKLHTYTVNGSQYHLTELRKIKRKKNFLPDGVISDSSVYQVCQQLYSLSKAKRLYSAQTPLGKMIIKLPDDADIERYEEQQDYYTDGMYIKLNGDLAYISRSSSVHKKKRGGYKQQDGPVEIQDVKLNVGVIHRIKIKLPNRK